MQNGTKLGKWLHRSVQNSSYGTIFNHGGLEQIDTKKFDEKETFDIWSSISEIKKTTKSQVDLKFSIMQDVYEMLQVFKKQGEHDREKKAPTYF